MGDRGSTAIRTSEPHSAGPHDPPGTISGHIRTTLGDDTQHDHQASLWHRRRDGRTVGTIQSLQHSPPEPSPFVLDFDSDASLSTQYPRSVGDAWSFSQPAVSCDAAGGASSDGSTAKAPLWPMDFLGGSWPMILSDPWTTRESSDCLLDWPEPVNQLTYEHTRLHHLATATQTAVPATIPIATPTIAGRLPRLQPFIAKLFSMLSRPEDFCDCLVWNTGGTAFVVSHDNPRLYTDVLPDAFGHSNLHSFTRQLNIYGFERCTQAELFDMLDVTSIAGYSGWHQPLFTRDNADRLSLLGPRPSRARQLRKEERRHREKEQQEQQGRRGPQRKAAAQGVRCVRLAAGWSSVDTGFLMGQGRTDQDVSSE